MSAVARLPQALTAPDDRGAIIDAIGEAMAAAESYAATASRFAEVRDTRGLAYSIRSAAACIGAAGELLSELVPSPAKGGRKP